VARHYNKSKYKPQYPNKYKGDPTNIICRSSWERKFARYCDLNENVLEWQSEEFCIPYRSPIDNKVHRYFPDFFIKYKDANGRIKSSLIEVKPLRQCAPPPKPKRQTKKYLGEAFEYAKNQAKWKAAREYCKDRLWEFKVLTEKELGIN